MFGTSSSPSAALAAHFNSSELGAGVDSAGGGRSCVVAGAFAGGCLGLEVLPPPLSSPGGMWPPIPGEERSQVRTYGRGGTDGMARTTRKPDDMARDRELTPLRVHAWRRVSFRAQ